MDTVEPRRAVVNTLVRGQFSVFDTDGYTKVPGLVAPTNITVTVYYNNVAVMTPVVTVAEISSPSGEYYFSFTPAAAGFYKIEIRVAAYTFTFSAEFDVSQQDGSPLPGQVFYDKVTDAYGNGIPYVTVSIYDANTAVLLVTKTTDYLGNYSVPLVGALAVPLLVDIIFSGGGIQTYTKTDVRLI